MMEMVEANWLLLVIALLIGLAVAWYVFHVKRTTRVTTDRRDVLDEGSDRAKRNQVLIDTPDDKQAVPEQSLERRDTVEPPIVTPAGLAGAGPAVAMGADREPAATPVAPAEEPIAQQQPAPPPANEDNALDLTAIKGLGPKLAARLNELGVTSVAQIAAWTEADIDRIDPQLGRFQGRVRRDDWVAQARLLVADDKEAYQRQFGNL